MPTTSTFFVDKNTKEIKPTTAPTVDYFNKSYNAPEYGTADICIEVFGYNHKKEAQEVYNALAAAGNISIIFFRPDKKFINWLVEYAAGRIIVEIGCGTADVLTQLADAGGRVFGIEPYWSMEDNAAMNMQRLEAGKNIINISPTYVKDNERLLKEMGSKALMLICRPCHNGFVEDAIDLKHPDTEVLYITVPENWDKYDDLGKYKDQAVLIEHKGWSADDEKVWSVK